MENKDRKIYSMLIEIRDTFFLSMQYAASLEEALNQAKLEFIRINPPTPGNENSLMGLKIGLFTIKKMDELIHESDIYDEKQLEKIVLKHQRVEKLETKEKEIKKPVEIKKVELTKEEVKNIIMKEIIRKKDKVMFEKNKELFNTYETQYLTEALKKLN